MFYYLGIVIVVYLPREFRRWTVVVRIDVVIWRFVVLTEWRFCLQSIIYNL